MRTCFNFVDPTSTSWDIAESKKNPGLYSKSPVFFVFFEKMGPERAPKAGSGGWDLDWGSIPAYSRVPIPVAIQLYYIGLGRVT